MNDFVTISGYAKVVRYLADAADALAKAKNEVAGTGDERLHKLINIAMPKRT